MSLKVSKIRVDEVKIFDIIRVKGCERISSRFEEMKHLFDTSVTKIEITDLGFYIFHTTAGVLQPKFRSHLIIKVENEKPKKDIFLGFNFGRERGKTFKGKSIE